MIGASFLARVAYTDGRVEPRRLSFVDARELVGGFIELVYEERSALVLLVNQDARELALPPNPTHTPYHGVVIAVEPHELVLV